MEGGFEDIDDDFRKAEAEARASRAAQKVAPATPAPALEADEIAPGFHCTDEDHWIRWRPVAALRGMRKLSVGADGTYRRFLDLQACDQTGAVEIDATALAVLKCSRKLWNRHRDELVTAGKIVEVRPSVFHNAAMARACRGTAMVLNGASVAGQASAAKRLERNGTRPTAAQTSEATRVPSSASTTKTKKKEEDTPIIPKPKPAEIDEEFEAEFWPDYPRRDNKAEAKIAYRKARAKTSKAQLLHALACYKQDRRVLDGYTVFAQKWLNKDQWADHPLPASGQAAPRPGQPANPPAFFPGSIEEEDHNRCILGAGFVLRPNGDGTFRPAPDPYAHWGGKPNETVPGGPGNAITQDHIRRGCQRMGFEWDGRVAKPRETGKA